MCVCVCVCLYSTCKLPLVCVCVCVCTPHVSYPSCVCVCVCACTPHVSYPSCVCVYSTCKLPLMCVYCTAGMIERIVECEKRSPYHHSHHTSPHHSLTDKRERLLCATNLNHHFNDYYQCLLSFKCVFYNSE